MNRRIIICNKVRQSDSAFEVPGGYYVSWQGSFDRSHGIRSADIQVYITRRNKLSTQLLRTRTCFKLFLNKQYCPAQTIEKCTQANEVVWEDSVTWCESNRYSRASQLTNLIRWTAISRTALKSTKGAEGQQTTTDGWTSQVNYWNEWQYEYRISRLVNFKCFSLHFFLSHEALQWILNQWLYWILSSAIYSDFTETGYCFDTRQYLP